MTTDVAASFERLLAVLQQDLIQATDEEILEAASDLGINPAMKGSAAFFGVTVGGGAQAWQSDPSRSWDESDGWRRLKDDPSS